MINVSPSMVLKSNNSNSSSPISNTSHKLKDVTLHDVWAGNLEEEFVRLRGFIDDYPFVAMDTEFPGVIATPVGQFKSKEDFNYQQLFCNVNVLKLIQVGFTLMNEQGELPPKRDIWQFNLHFNLTEDMYSNDSVDLLRLAGFDFSRHQNEGILMEDFGELLTTSGLLVDPKITWITFHSCFDFAYLIKAVMSGKLPEDEKEFFQYHKKLFPKSYDIKMLLRQPAPCAAMLKGGLQEVADQLHVQRIGQRHQAGSDSLLTAMTFFKLQELFFDKNWEQVSTGVQGHMFGLSSGSTTPYSLPSYNHQSQQNICASAK